MAGRRRVLIVEDDPEARESLHALLEVWGYDSESAGNGEEALQICTRRAPEIVIMDLGLPDVEGCEVIRRIKAQAHETVVVVFSGYDKMDGMARNAGADEFVLKPDIPALARLLGRDGDVEPEVARNVSKGRR